VSLSSAAPQRDDRDLAQQLAHGSQAAFAELFERHSAAVFRYAWALVDHRGDEDDVVQDTFLVAWRRRRSLPDAIAALPAAEPASLLPWLLTTCRFSALNQNRRRRRERADELTDASPLGALRALAAEREESRATLAWVRDELAALGPIERRLCELTLIEGRAYDDAARELGLTPAAARKRVQRVRERLRLARDAVERGAR
jgi:RNA polymerase sigma-70 factor (ECF subfamily)